MQSDNNNPKSLRPIAFYSKTLSGAQKRYSTTKKEFLAIYMSLLEFKFLILGYPITVLTDHKPLTPLFSRKLPADSAMARWCLEIDNFNVNLVYFEGKRNVVADYLSRIDDNPLLESDIENSEILRNRDFDDSNELLMNECMLVNTRSKTLKNNSDHINTHSKNCDNIGAILSDELENQNADHTSTKTIPLINYIPNQSDLAWSLEELKIAQNSDPFCISVFDFFKNKSKLKIKNVENFFINNEILYRKRSLLENGSEFVNFVIPTSLLNKVILGIHYNTHTDHTHTLFRFKLKFYHPQEASMIKRFVSSCDVCKILKARVDIPIKLQTSPVATRPFQTVAFDFIGPFISTDQGNRYILSIVDLFSRFCILHAVSNKDTLTVIDSLKSTFNLFGYPDTLLSDNAMEFTSEAMRLFSKLHGIYKCEVLAYSPYSNGICERNNSRINKLLRYYVNSVAHNNWDLFLSEVQNTLNNQVISTLKDTPAYTLFGYDTHSQIKRTKLTQIYELNTATNIINYRATENARIQETIRNNIIKQTEKRHNYANLKRKNKSFNVGDRVLLRNNSKKHKLDLSWLGPAKIISVCKNRCKILLHNETMEVNINLLIKLCDVYN